MQRRRKFAETHAATHAAEVAEKTRDQRVVTAYDTVQIDHQHTVLHVLNDEPVHLLQIGDVNAALGGEILGQLRIAAERDGDADRREVPEADEPGLEERGHARAAVDGAIRFEAQQHDGREGGVEKPGAGSL